MPFKSIPPANQRDAIDSHRRTTVLGRYRLDRPLGSGATGRVHLATDLNDDSQVVLKMLDASLVGSSRSQARFLDEARILAGIHHENVIRVLDVGFDREQRPFFVMEHVDGVTLRDVLGREGLLSLRRAATLTTQILSALCAVHDKGTVHRDVKPDNVLVVQEDEREQVKLLDFGIGHDLRGRIRRTGRDVALGTPGYMAPEQILGEPVDARTDLYGAACTMFRMLAGRAPTPPGASDRPAEYFQAVISADPAPISRLRSGVPAELDALLAQALSRDPEARPPDCQRMREALLEMLPSLSDELPPGYPRTTSSDQEDVDTVRARS